MSTIKIVSVEYPIEAGPEAGRLCDALKYAYGKGKVENLVHFEVKNPSPTDLPDERLKLFFRPISVAHEDGSGKSFNIIGFISKNCCIPRYAGRRFTAYYNCGSPRHGIIKIEMP